MNNNPWHHNQPLVFAHRGASAAAPMNTLPAYELAAQQGADGIELDVHFSRDGAVVVIHDFTVDATTDGHGRVREMSLAQLKELDAGSWFDAAYRGAKIPTLDEVFEAVGQKLLLNIELKSKSVTGAGLERAVAARIAHFGMEARVLVSSFNPFALRRFRRALPAVPIGFLHAPDSKPYLKFFLLGLKHEARHPHHTVIDEAYMRWARKKGYRVNTWTVNEPERARELRDLGVNMVISDTPDAIRAALQS